MAGFGPFNPFPFKLGGKARPIKSILDSLNQQMGSAYVRVPDGSYPWGTVEDGRPWYSTVQHILVRLQKPTGATEADFYAAAGTVVGVLDPLLPSDCTIDWYRAPTVGAPINVTGGPSAAGFYLDEPNLDLEVFDV